MIIQFNASLWPNYFDIVRFHYSLLQTLCIVVFFPIRSRLLYYNEVNGLKGAINFTTTNNIATGMELDFRLTLIIR